MHKLLLLKFTILLLLACPVLSGGQTLDSIRQTARNGHYSEAREMCMERDDYPDNTEVLFLVGQTYLWEENTPRARETFENVLKNEPEHTDAISALTAIDIAKEKYEKAIQRSRKGLTIKKDHEDLLYYLAFAHAETGKLKTATKELDNLLKIAPGHEKGLELKQSLDIFKIPGSIALYQSVQWHKEPFERYFHTTTIEAPLGDRKFKVIPRLNYGVLKMPEQETTGSQAGIDVYPLTGPASYMYLHYAYSDSEIFPGHRSAAEWFTGAGKGWELSAGARYLFWEDHIYFFSASASKYIGQWLPGLRFFYAPEENNDLSAQATIRRYLKDQYSYIHMYLGYGTNPDRSERQIDLMDTKETTRLTGGAYSILRISGPFYTRLLAEYRKEEYVPDEWRDAFLIQAGLEYKF
ncbi:MAG: YaiO family outer membrane beta-barrel protein [Marinilabilia sp.]